MRIYNNLLQFLHDPTFVVNAQLEATRVYLERNLVHATFLRYLEVRRNLINHIRDQLFINMTRNPQLVQELSLVDGTERILPCSESFYQLLQNVHLLQMSIAVVCKNA